MLKEQCGVEAMSERCEMVLLTCECVFERRDASCEIEGVVFTLEHLGRKT
jgi:hypothetical protein